jgi:hypothetical protein
LGCLILRDGFPSKKEVRESECARDRHRVCGYLHVPKFPVVTENLRIVSFFKKSPCLPFPLGVAASRDFPQFPGTNEHLFRVASDSWQVSSHVFHLLNCISRRRCRHSPAHTTHPTTTPNITMACIASTFTGSVAALKASKVQVRLAAARRSRSSAGSRDLANARFPQILPASLRPEARRR